MIYNKGKKIWTETNINIVAKDDKGNITGTCSIKDPIATEQFTQLVPRNILNTVEGVTDTTGTARSIPANTACTIASIVAGIGVTAAAVTDFALTIPVAGSSGNTSATTNPYAGSGTSRNFTVTGTITNSSGSTIQYSELGIQITIATVTFLISHDVFSPLSVSNGGTLAVTYTATFSWSNE